jgi:hypothetical protein
LRIGVTLEKSETLMWNGHASEETQMSQREFDQRVAEQLEVV